MPYGHTDTHRDEREQHVQNCERPGLRFERCSAEGAGLLLGRPPDVPLEGIEPLIEAALRAARSEGIAGQAVTPFVLSFLHRESGGRTLKANRDLIAQNARLAGEIAVAAS